MAGLARGSIDPDADKVVRRLARRGHQAYLVGGCVRDLLLDRTPKDFDVATSATPNEIKQLFRNCRIIGRRFRLAHIFFGSKIIETSTFRANPRGDDDEVDVDNELLIRRDNVFGSDIEDARRRDFTVNGLFYDVETEEVIDHVGGLADLQARLIRTIGEPNIRFREDPVRMLRAVKFAARLGFQIEPETYEALVDNRLEIRKCAPPRVLEEVYRLLRGGAARRSIELLIQTGIAAALSPHLASLYATPIDPDAEPSAAQEADATLDDEEAAWRATWQDEESLPAAPVELSHLEGDDELSRCRALGWQVLDQLDVAAADRAELTNATVLAAIVNPFVADKLIEPGVRATDANAIILETVQPIIDELRVARRDAERVRQVLLAQRRLAPARRRRGRPMALVRRDYFDEALMVYEVTALAAGRDVDDVERWRQLREQGDDDSGDDDGSPRKRRRRRRGGRRRRRTPVELEATPANPTDENGAGAAAGG